MDKNKIDELFSGIIEQLKKDEKIQDELYDATDEFCNYENAHLFLMYRKELDRLADKIYCLYDSIENP